MKSTQTQSTLPPELWTSIFAYFSASELFAAKSVCRHWRSLVSSMRYRALCIFEDVDILRLHAHHVMVETQSIRVRIDQYDMSPNNLDTFLLPRLTPLIRIWVYPMRGDWDAIPSDFPLFDTIRQMVFDRCGLNATLALMPSALKPARFPTRFGIPVEAYWHELENILAIEHDVIWPDTLEYLSTIKTLEIYGVGDQTQFINALVLMPNINHVYVDKAELYNLDCGLDTLPNLRSLEINGFFINPKLLGDIAKLRYLERLQFERSWVYWSELDVDVICDMFTALPRLWFLSADKEAMTLFDTIYASKKLRHAMQNITHFDVSFSELSGPVNIIADAIETISHLENVNQITAYFSIFVDPLLDPVDAHIAEAHSMARELRSASRCIDIIEFPL